MQQPVVEDNDHVDEGAGTAPAPDIRDAVGDAAAPAPSAARGGRGRLAMMSRGKSLTDVMASFTFNPLDDDDDDSSEGTRPPRDGADAVQVATAAADNTEEVADRRRLGIASVISARPGFERSISQVSFAGIQNLETGSFGSLDDESTLDESSVSRMSDAGGMGKRREIDEGKPVVAEANLMKSISFGQASNIRTHSLIHRADSLEDLSYNRVQSTAEAAALVAMEDGRDGDDESFSTQEPQEQEGAGSVYRPWVSKMSSMSSTSSTMQSKSSPHGPEPKKSNRSALRNSILSTYSSADTVNYVSATAKGGSGDVNTSDRTASTINNSDRTASTASSWTGVTPLTSNKKMNKATAARNNRLTKISAMYDLDGDGVLDEIEQAMRNRDVNNDGNLGNAEVYKIVRDQLKNQSDVHLYKRMAGGLVCLVAILSLSNFATSWASAILAQDTVADPVTGTIQSKATGEVMGYQNVGYEIDLEPLTDEEFEERRLLVDSEMGEDPDHEDHVHRRLGRKDDRNKLTTKIGYDHGKLKEKDLQELIRKCDGVNTVSMKRKWRNLDGSDDYDVDTICGPGTTVSKKGKKKKNKNKTKTRVVEEQVKFKRGDGGNKGKAGGRGRDDYKEISFTCSGGYCYGSGSTLLQEEGHPCEISRDRRGAGECVDGLICYDPESNGRGPGTCTHLLRYARKNQVCDVDYGVDACDVGYACRSSSTTTLRSRVAGVITTGICQKLVRQSNNQDVCDASFGSDACVDGYSCIGESGIELNGRGIGYCQQLVQRQREGGLCDLSYGHDACDDGYYCRDGMLASNRARGGGNDRGAGRGGDAWSNAVIFGPSDTFVAGNGNRAGQVNGNGHASAIISGPSTFVAGNSNRAGQGNGNGHAIKRPKEVINLCGGSKKRSFGTGMCTRTVGRMGQCGSNDECSDGRSCAGLGADTATGGVTQGEGGTIVWGTGGATIGHCV